jgi:hypothetical protein
MAIELIIAAVDQTFLVTRDSWLVKSDASQYIVKWEQKK